MPGNASGVAAVERAISLLEAFTERDIQLSLGELSRRTELDKSTVLRIARSLAKSGMLVRNDDASWRLGPKLFRLGSIYQATFQPAAIVEPLLVEISDRTGESAALYVPEGGSRICLFRHDSRQSIRHSTRVGDLRPLERGAPGRILLVFAGGFDPEAEAIRARGWLCTLGERDPEVGSIAAPVFRHGGALFGSLAVTGPVLRFTDEAVAGHLPILLEGAARLSAAMGSSPESQPQRAGAPHLRTLGRST